MRGRALALAIALAWPAAARAQSSPATFVPLGSRLDRLALWAAQAGALPGVDAETRPFRLIDVRTAASAVDTAAASPGALRAWRWLDEELGAWRDSDVVVADVSLGAYRNGRRDSFRPGGASGAAPAGVIRAGIARGPFVALIEPAFDNRLKDDPEYTGYTQRFIAGRMQEAYVATGARFGWLMVGRVARNWGPGLFDGLLVSPSAYPFEGIAGSLRAGRFSLVAITQRLDDRDTLAAVPFQRWLAAHRLSIDLGRGARLALSEVSIYGGRGQGFDPIIASPLNLGLLSQINEGRRVNTMLGADLRVQRGATSGSFQLYLDDVQIEHDTSALSHRPSSYGFTAVLATALAAAPVHLSLGYTRVSSLAYRNSFQPDFEYSFRGVGLARNFSDYDQVLARIEVRSRRASAALDLSYLRQGSGDFRQPFPPDSVLAQPGQGFLVAPVYSAPGVRLSGTAEPATGIEVSGEVGATRTSAGKADGIAALTLHLRFDVLRRKMM